jgi:hypothetical protein
MRPDALRLGQQTHELSCASPDHEDLWRQLFRHRRRRATVPEDLGFAHRLTSAVQGLLVFVLLFVY